MWLLRRKSEAVTRKEEWEDFKLSDYVDESKQNADRPGAASAHGLPPQSANSEKMPGMSAHREKPRPSRCPE